MILYYTEGYLIRTMSKFRKRQIIIEKKNNIFFHFKKKKKKIFNGYIEDNQLEWKNIRIIGDKL